MNLDIWSLLAGVGILLYGMSIFEQALNFLGGKKLKYLLQKYTKTGWMAIWTGTWTTTVMQSSSLVSLLILAFVGAGVMQLQNAIGVIFGANIGSPMLPLLTALIGFGEFKISTLALPLIAIGGFSLIFVKNEKRARAARLLVGFGLLFVGLDWMKDSVATIKETFDLASYKDMSLWGFGILGIVVTVIIQSSGALGIMALTALDAGIITFPASIAIAVGSNLGTTFTAVLGSLGGRRIKRQVATAHVLVNVFSTFFGVVFFWQYIRVVNHLFGLEDNPVLGSAVWNVIYNASTSILFGFFLVSFTKLVKRLLPDEKSDQLTLHIDSLDKLDNPSFASPALMALAEDTKIIIHQGQSYIDFIYGIHEKLVNTPEFSIEEALKHRLDRSKSDHIKTYENTKNIANKMLLVVSRLKQFKMNDSSANQLHTIETSIYSTLKAIKAVKNIRRDILDLRESEDEQSKVIYEQIVTTQLQISRHLSFVHEGQTGNYEELIRAVEVLKNHHQAFIKHISSLTSLGQMEDVSLATLINIDHYVYEASEMISLAYANTYLNHYDVKNFETTQDIEEEIYESFSTD